MVKTHRTTLRWKIINTVFFRIFFPIFLNLFLQLTLSWNVDVLQQYKQPVHSICSFVLLLLILSLYSYIECGMWYISNASVRIFPRYNVVPLTVVLFSVRNTEHVRCPRTTCKTVSPEFVQHRTQWPNYTLWP